MSATTLNTMDDSQNFQKRVLVAPLNWGLGHVSRCIPLIRSLENLGAKVVLASDGIALSLLKAEFPHLPAIALPSYRIRYFSNKMVRNIARQMPRILYAIRTEQWATERIVRDLQIQGIISDNRYGCFSDQTQNVLLTHQLNLRIPNHLLEWTANAVLRRAFAKFDTIWVPDAASEPTLSGELSHPATGLKAVQYLGLLSRAQAPALKGATEYDVAVVLSGPEPQRTNLEQMLLEQAILLPQKFIFIQGKTQSKEQYFAAENVEVVSYLTTEELNRVVAASETVICRSGYSSLMDLAANQKPAILIPTPGQTEQEYLADYLAIAGYFTVQQQQSIDLKAALISVKKTTGLGRLHLPVNEHEPILRNWLSGL